MLIFGLAGRIAQPRITAAARSSTSQWRIISVNYSYHVDILKKVTLGSRFSSTVPPNKVRDNSVDKNDNDVGNGGGRSTIISNKDINADQPTESQDIKNYSRNEQSQSTSNDTSNGTTFSRNGIHFSDTKATPTATNLLKLDRDPLRDLIEEKERAFRQLEIQKNKEIAEAQRKLLENSQKKTAQHQHEVESKDAEKLLKKLEDDARKIIQDQAELILEAGELANIIDERKNFTSDESSINSSNTGAIKNKERQALPFENFDLTQFVQTYFHDKPLELQRKAQESLAHYRTQKLQQFDQYYEIKKTQLFENLGLLSNLINDITGYTEVNNAKQNIDKFEKQVSEAQQVVKLRKQQYSDAINTRTKTQKDINELLTRKHSWTPSDLEHFTHLYREDHASGPMVKTAEENLEKSELALEQIRGSLVKEISKKYHEEYLWNIKMRGLSSWVTVGLMVLNIVILLLTQTFFEPLKVQRIVNNFEERFEQRKEELTGGVDEKLEEVKDLILQLQGMKSSQNVDKTKDSDQKKELQQTNATAHQKPLPKDGEEAKANITEYTITFPHNTIFGAFWTFTKSLWDAIQRRDFSTAVLLRSWNKLTFDFQQLTKLLWKDTRALLSSNFSKNDILSGFFNKNTIENEESADSGFEYIKTERHDMITLLTGAVSVGAAAGYLVSLMIQSCR